MTEITFSQAVTGFELDMAARHLAIGTVLDYQNTFRQFVNFLHDDPPFADITINTINRFLASRQVKNKTVLNYHTGLSAIYSWAVRSGLADDNLLHDIPRPVKEKPAIVELSKNQVKDLLAAIDKSRSYERPGKRACAVRLPNSDRNRAILLLFLDTGIRVSELCDLTINRCDLKTRWIKVWGKGSKERTIPISARTSQVIWRYLTGRPESRINDPLFVTREGTSMTRKNVLDMVADLGDRAGVDDVHPHRLRHTFAITYLRNGGDVYTLQDILGHTTLEMVSKYLHIARTDVENGHRKASPVDNWGL